MKGDTFSTSDPVTLQSTTLTNAKNDFPIERAVNQREVELRRSDLWGNLTRTHIHPLWREHVGKLSNELTMPLDFLQGRARPKL